MSRTTKSLATYSYSRKNRVHKFNRKDEFIPKGFSRNRKVQGRYSEGGWISSNHIRGLLRKYLGKPYNDFYSEFCELYRNTTWFSDKRYLVEVFKPVIIPEHSFPAVKLHISINRYGTHEVDRIEYLNYEKIFPECVEYESRTHYSGGTTYSLEDLSRRYCGAFYLDNGAIKYVEHVPFKHVPYELYRIGHACRVACDGIFRTLYIVDKDIKPYVKSASELWSERWCKEAEKRKKYQHVEPAEYIQCGTKMVEYYDIDEDLNIIPIMVEEPRFKRKKIYRYNREYLTRKERKTLQKAKRNELL